MFTYLLTLVLFLSRPKFCGDKRVFVVMLSASQQKYGCRDKTFSGGMEVGGVNMVSYVHRNRKAYQGRANGDGGSKQGALCPPKK